jgi:hypothetical protein
MGSEWRIKAVARERVVCGRTLVGGQPRTDGTSARWHVRTMPPPTIGLRQTHWGRIRWGAKVLHHRGTPRDSAERMGKRDVSMSLMSNGFRACGLPRSGPRCLIRCEWDPRGRLAGARGCDLSFSEPRGSAPRGFAAGRSPSGRSTLAADKRASTQKSTHCKVDDQGKSPASLETCLLNPNPA